MKKKLFSSNWIVLISLLLVLSGFLILVLANTPYDGNINWKGMWTIIGGVMLQAGIISLIFEFISLQKLFSEKIPQSIFKHGYLDIASNTELLTILSNTLQKSFRQFPEKRYYEVGTG